MLNLAKICFKNYYKYKRKAPYWNLLQTNQLRSNVTAAAGNLRLLFFGTDNFSLPSLEALHRWKLKYATCEKSLGVVTSFKNPANCVRLYADKANLPLYRWPIDTDIIDRYDVGIVVSFGHLIPEKVINAFPFGMINVHASLLPRWRGAAPIIYAIMNGDRTTGVSIMKVEPKHFDIGDIMAQEEIPIKKNTFMPELHNEMAQKGANLLINVLAGFPHSFWNAKEQSGDVSYAPKISPAITEVNWATSTAHDLHRSYRALYGFKHLIARFQDRNVQLVELQLPSTAISNMRSTTTSKLLTTPGEFVYRRDRNCLVVRCADNSEIEVHRLRMEGKKVMQAADFNNGFLKNLKTTKLLFECCRN